MNFERIQEYLNRAQAAPRAQDVPVAPGQPQVLGYPQLFRDEGFGSSPSSARRPLDSASAKLKRAEVRSRGGSAVYAETAGPKNPQRLAQPTDAKVSATASTGFWSKTNRWWASTYAQR